MDVLLSKLSDLGTIGIVAALAIWQIFYLTKRIFTVIENNTKAITELTVIIKTRYAKDS